MPHLPATLKLALSADEQMHRYFKRMENELLEAWRCARVERLLKNNDIEVLQLIHVYHDGRGVIIPGKMKEQS